MSKPTRDQVLLELMDFFLEELAENEDSTIAWLVQGDYDADEFIAAVQAYRSVMRRLLGD